MKIKIGHFYNDYILYRLRYIIWSQINGPYPKPLLKQLSCKYKDRFHDQVINIRKTYFVSKNADKSKNDQPCYRSSLTPEPQMTINYSRSNIKTCHLGIPYQEWLLWHYHRRLFEMKTKFKKNKHKKNIL
jgi:hypothetical protein